jgi:hypothetical protein
MNSVSFAPGIIEFLVMVLMMGATIVLTVVPFWVIFQKAGFPGALSLLMMVPGINVVMLFVLAFARWPALARDEKGEIADRS